MKVRRSKQTLDLRNLPLDGFDMFLVAQLERELSMADLLDLLPCDAREALRRVHALEQHGVLELLDDEGQAHAPHEARDRAEAARTKLDASAQPAAGRAQALLRAHVDPVRAEVAAVRARTDARASLGATRVEPDAVRQHARAERPTVQVTFDPLSECWQPKRPSTGREVDEECMTLRPPSPAKRAHRQRDEAATLRPPAPLAVKEMMRAAEEATMPGLRRSSEVRERAPLQVEFRTPSEAVTTARAAPDRAVFSRQTVVDADVHTRAEETRSARRR